MSFILKDIELIILAKLDPVSARMYGETCQEAKALVTKHVEYATNNEMCMLTARFGYLNVLKYARESGCIWNVLTFNEATKTGNLEIVKYIHLKGCPWNNNACYNAAMNGHLTVLKYVYANGCAWHSETCTIAARNGHLEVLEWCAIVGYLCSYENIGYGVGSLKSLKYVQDMNQSWYPRIGYIAAKRGHLEVLKYLYENKYSSGGLICEFANRAVNKGTILEWLASSGHCKCDGRFH
jgi:hypothetical protein